MKRIWWFNHHAVPPTVPGGTRHYSLAKALNDKFGYEVSIINGSYDHLRKNSNDEYDIFVKKQTPKHSMHDGVSFYTIPTPVYSGHASVGRMKNMLCYYYRSQRYVQSIKEKPDIIIGSTVHPLGALAGYHTAKRLKIPFIYEVRDLWPKTLIESYSVSTYHPVVVWMNYIDKQLALNANFIITTAFNMKKHYEETWGIPQEKIVWITNGTDFINNPCSFRKAPQGHQKYEVGYTGNFGAVYGILYVLKELSGLERNTLDKFNFTFIGTGETQNEIEQYSNSNNLPVKFLKPVPKERIWSHLESFDLLLSPLRNSSIFRYGISLNKMADYHAAGRPIIEIVNAKDTPVQLSGGGIHIDSAKELPYVLQKIVSSPPEYLSLLGQKAREYALDNYSWKKLAGKLDEKIKEIL